MATNFLDYLKKYRQPVSSMDSFGQALLKALQGGIDRNTEFARQKELMKEKAALTPAPKSFEEMLAEKLAVEKAMKEMQQSIDAQKPRVPSATETAKSDLAKSAKSALTDIKGSINDSSFGQLKAIKSSGIAGDLVTNISDSNTQNIATRAMRAASDMLYIKSGATATKQEIEREFKMLMPFANEKKSDWLNRLNKYESDVDIYLKSGAVTPTGGGFVIEEVK